MPGPSDRDTLQPWAARDWGPLQHMLVVDGFGEGMHIGIVSLHPLGNDVSTEMFVDRPSNTFLDVNIYI